MNAIAGGWAVAAGAAQSPFAPGNDAAYARWRSRKLEARARTPQDLVVEVRDPRALSEAEKAEIVRRCRRDDMAVYASAAAGEKIDNDEDRAYKYDCFKDIHHKLDYASYDTHSLLF